MFGYTAEEIVGRPIRMIIPADRQSEEDKVLATIRDGRAVEHFETVRQRKDGSLIEISLSVSPVRARDGTIIGASKIARDISEQRRLARRAEEAGRAKDEFLAMLSHELRTPLNAVLGYTRMLRDGRYTDERREQVIEIIERNASVLSQLVSDVLDVSDHRHRQGPADAEAVRYRRHAAGRQRQRASVGGRQRAWRCGSRSLMTRRHARGATPIGCSRCSGICCRTRSSSRRAAAS